MRALSVVLAVLLVNIVSGGVLQRQYLHRHIDHHLWNQRHGSRVARLPAPQYHVVAQDHFDGSNLNTWNQAYYVNDTFWTGRPDSPVFLCVGGEGPPIDGSAVVSSVHCNVAVELLESTGALMFAVEHRYYGCHNASACPVSDLAAPDALRFLSSRQALNDLAAFHAHATAKYGLDNVNTPWVTFGGSYPGMLAGWARWKFPHLFYASIASSAPVKAQLDFVGYNDIVAYAYTVSDNGVGGSEECANAIGKGHATVGTMLGTDSGRSQLASLFGLPSADWLKDPTNQKEFAGEGVAYFMAQGNDPACMQPACNIARICSIMTNGTGTPVERLAAVRKAQAAWLPSAVSELHARLDDLPPFWDYQTCTEFAFYQTCEVGSKCFFTQGLIGIDDFLSECVEKWNISKEAVARNVDRSNVFYGADQPVAERILYPNGEVDPWRGLSIVEDPARGSVTVLSVPGASHHAWTHPTLPTDQASVVAARGTIRNLVKAWLKDAKRI